MMLQMSVGMLRSMIYICGCEIHWNIHGVDDIIIFINSDFSVHFVSNIIKSTILALFKIQQDKLSA